MATTAAAAPRTWTVKLSKVQEKHLVDLLDGADKAERDADPVKAFLYLKEALRLEQLWTSNMLGDDSPATQELKRFTAMILHAESGQLMTVLHSKRISLNDKVNLVHILEDDVIMNYPDQRGDEMMGDAFAE